MRYSIYDNNPFKMVTPFTPSLSHSLNRLSNSISYEMDGVM